MININSSAPRAATVENPIEEAQPTEEPRPTEGPQPPKVRSSPAEGKKATINPAKREEWSQHVYPCHYTEIQPDDMILKLVGQKSLDDDWYKKAKEIRTDWKTGQEECVLRLNEISRSVCQHMGLSRFFPFGFV